MRQKMEDTSTSIVLPTSDFLICHTGDTSELKPAHIATYSCLYKYLKPLIQILKPSHTNN